MLPGVAPAAKTRDSRPSPAVAGGVVSVHLGWRNDPAGTLVASWRADRPPAVPEHLQSVMVPSDGSCARPRGGR
jgi:hypothetical protein